MSSSKNYACKNRNEDGYTDENNDEDNSINDNNNDEVADNDDKKVKSGLVNFFGGLLQPFSKSVFSQSGISIHKQLNKYLADSEDDNDDDDSLNEEDEEEDEDDKLENIFNFVDISVWKKICDGCGLFKNLAEEKKEMKDSFFGGLFEKKKLVSLFICYINDQNVFLNRRRVG